MELEQKIKNIPFDGEWWKASSEKEFLDAAKILIQKGFSEDESVHFLENLYIAASECWGGP